MRNIHSYRSLAGIVATASLVATLSASHAAQQPDAIAPLASHDQAGFGEAIVFVASGYTPPGIAAPVRWPLASQDEAGFGEPIAFVASGYTPPGIAPLAIDVVAR